MPLLSYLCILFLCASSTPTHFTRRLLTHVPEHELQQPPLISKTSFKNFKNQTKLVKPKKLNSTSSPFLNQTKSMKPKKLNSTLTSKLPKLNKTLTLKPTNSSKFTKTPLKASNSTKLTKPVNSIKVQPKHPKPVEIKPIWLDDLDPKSDLLSEFRDLPTRLHQTLLPNLKKLSITSKAYILEAHKNIAQNVKPFVGKKFAPKFAFDVSCIFLILPLCLVTAVLYQLNTYLSLYLPLILMQAYLGIYFLTLSVTALVTGLDPLTFFYATSPSWYVLTQAVQMLGYSLYLLLQLIHLVVVFSAGEGRGMVTRMLGLGQMIVGLVVGCHYYVVVFHWAVIADPPHADWKVHGFYAGCFLVICLLARAERRKKGYECDGGVDGKKSLLGLYTESITFLLTLFPYFFE